MPALHNIPSLLIVRVYRTGYRGVKTAFTYSWKPVNNTDFAVCVVVSDNELETKVKKGGEL